MLVICQQRFLFNVFFPFFIFFIKNAFFNVFLFLGSTSFTSIPISMRWLFTCTGEAGATRESNKAGTSPFLGRARSDGPPVRIPGPTDVVGVLVGYHGARHLLRDLRYGHGHVRLSPAHHPGMYS